MSFVLTTKGLYIFLTLTPGLIENMVILAIASPNPAFTSCVVLVLMHIESIFSR